MRIQSRAVAVGTAGAPLWILGPRGTVTVTRSDGLWVAQVPGPALVRNVSATPQVVSVASTVSEGAAGVATVQETLTLAPGSAWRLQAPPPGGQWLLIAGPPGLWATWGALLALAGVTVLGLAVVGAWSVGRALRRRAHGHHVDRDARRELHA
jgi:hypothetical protein